MAVGIGGLVGWAGSTRRMRRLQTENDSLRIQFRRLGELEVNLARLSELNEQMQKMLGVSLPATDAETDSLAGVGGATDGGAKRSPGDQHDSPAGGEMDIPAAPGVSH